MPPSDGAAGMQLCLWALGYPSAPVLPLKQIPELSRAKGNQKVVWLCAQGLGAWKKEAHMPQDLEAVGQQVGEGLCLWSSQVPPGHTGAL